MAKKERKKGMGQKTKLKKQLDPSCFELLFFQKRREREKRERDNDGKKEKKNCHHLALTF